MALTTSFPLLCKLKCRLGYRNGTQLDIKSRTSGSGEDISTVKKKPIKLVV